MSFWSIDLGTSNSAIARWDEIDSVPQILHFHNLCQQKEGLSAMNADDKIPSSVYITPPRSFIEKLSHLPVFAKNTFFKSWGLIGREALEKDFYWHSPAFVSSFKTPLSRDAYQSLTKIRNISYSSSRVTAVFIRELMRHAFLQTKERPRQVSFTVPVDSYESYRIALKTIAGQLGIKKFSTVDEPVAAALGYGVQLSGKKRVLVFDFGGGTLDLALVEITPGSAEQGTADVIAKTGLFLGGNLVDSWILEKYCTAMRYYLTPRQDDHEAQWWFRIMKAEAQRVKEALYFHEKEPFCMELPDELKNFEMRLKADTKPTDDLFYFSRNDLVQLLEEKDMFTSIDLLFGEVFQKAKEKNITEDNIDEVLLVGGSILLPNVYQIIEERFGRDRVRAWQPFSAVVYGGCVFSAGYIMQSDFISHDYAFVTHNQKTHKQEYNVIIPRGTIYPTKQDFWKRHLVPTCPLGEPEKMFKLLICEIGRQFSQSEQFVWDKYGKLHSLDSENDGMVIVPLNEDNPALGYLNPPHSPFNKKPRLEIAFMVNDDRWLCATVFDLKTRRSLMTEEPVCRLK